MNTTEHKIPDAMLNAAIRAAIEAGFPGESGLIAAKKDSARRMAEAALKSARVGELLDVLENLLNHAEEFFSDFPMEGKETELTSKAKAVIARAKGEA